MPFSPWVQEDQMKYEAGPPPQQIGVRGIGEETVAVTESEDSQTTGV